uniref:Uncharacterized protein n=1 Tax=Daphnia galeata TaxID=27404 RepID=A0A8J2WMQ3_9CRUS|nr:unnamed protein product [Daphnia galeata]
MCPPEKGEDPHRNFKKREGESHHSMINSLAPGRQNGSQGPSSASLSDSGVVAVESCP